MSPTPSLRRTDLDWMRVAAFGLLLLFHVALVFAPWDFHVHSRHTVGWLKEAILVTGPWRLTLLFLISGCAVRFMSRRMTPGGLVKARILRLAPPLLFGVLVLVPLQAWFEAMDKAGFTGGPVAWWLWQFGPEGLKRGVPLNHLWFVLYIGVYSLAAAALMTRPAWIEAIGDWCERNLTGWRMLVLPIAYLFVTRQLLYPFFWITNNLPTDWYNHSVSLVVFLFGFAIAGREATWSAFEAMARPALILSLASLPLLMAFEAHPGGLAFLGGPKNLTYAVYQWGVIASVLGYGSRYLRGKDSPALRYLTEAVFPCYIAHQTILVATVFWVKPWNLPAPAEAAIFLVATFGGSLLLYEIVRRIDVIRPIWGLKRHPAPVRSAAAEGARPV